MKRILILFLLCSIALGTLNTSINSRPITTGDGATVVYTFAFPLVNNDTSTLVVQTYNTSTETRTTLTLNVDYTLSATNNRYDSGGTVTFTTAPTTSEEVLVYRKPPISQDFAIGNTSSMRNVRTTTMENSIDEGVSNSQYMNWLWESQFGDTDGDFEVYHPNERASTYWGSDADGKLTPYSSVSTSTLPVTTWWGTRVGTDPNTWFKDFSYDANGTEALATIVADSNTALAKETLNFDVINVTDYGATGTDSTDDTAAFDLAISKLSATRKVLYIPAGSYYISNIEIPATVGIVKGDGKQVTQINKYGSGTDPMISFSAATTTTSYAEFRDFKITGNAKTHDGIQMDNMARFSLEDLFITTCDRAIDSNGCLVYDVEDCTLQSNNTGLYIHKDAAYANLITVENCTIVANTSHGINYGEGASLIVRGCDIETNGTASDATTGGIYIQDTVDDEDGYGSVSIRDTWFESNSGWGYQNESTSQVRITMDNVSFRSGDEGNAWVKGAASLSLKNILIPSATGLFDVNSVDHVWADSSLIGLFDFDDATYYGLFGVAGGATSYNGLHTNNIQTPTIQIAEQGGGGNVLTLTQPVITGNLVWQFPVTDGNDGDTLLTNGSGALEWNTN